MLVFVEEGKLENPEKNPRSKAITKNKLNPHMTLGRNLACEQAPSEVGKIFGERSEWESERRDSASAASGTHSLLTRPLSARLARPRLHSAISP